MGKKFHFKVDKIEDRYSIIMQIGTGTYGTVYKCRGPDGQIVALKHIKIMARISSKDGIPLSTIREINILHMLKHENIVTLKEIVSTKDDQIYFVFEYCEFDLFGLLYDKEIRSKITMNHLISYQKQLLLALKTCHSNCVLHRDIKPANVFITKDNIVKLGDFGLARKMYKERNVKYSSGVITLYYRAPELLMGSKNYGPEVDIWSVGCVFFEMITKDLLFRSPRDSLNRGLAQLERIFEICGTPNFEEWPEAENFDIIKKIKEPKPNKLKAILHEKIPSEYSEIIDLIEGMLQLSPSKRITAEEAYNHPFFQKFDDNINPDKLPILNIKEIHQKNITCAHNTIKIEKKSY